MTIQDWYDTTNIKHWRFMFDHHRSLDFQPIYDAARTRVMVRLNPVVRRIPLGRLERLWNQ